MRNFLKKDYVLWSKNYLIKISDDLLDDAQAILFAKASADKKDLTTEQIVNSVIDAYEDISSIAFFDNLRYAQLTYNSSYKNHQKLREIRFFLSNIKKLETIAKKLAIDLTDIEKLSDLIGWLIVSFIIQNRGILVV